MSERASFDLALRLRTHAGAPIGEVFSFLSGLYFRGKLTYARAFARVPDSATDISGNGIFVITPSSGLRSPETMLTLDAIRAFAGVDVDAANPKYRKPLERSAKALASDIGPETTVVLARQHRVREVRGRAPRDLRQPPHVSAGIRRSWRHEPRRPAAAVRSGRRGADLRADRGRHPPRGAAAETRPCNPRQAVVRPFRADLTVFSFLPHDSCDRNA